MPPMAEPSHWDSMYAQSPETIPWEIASPPHDLVDALEKTVVTPCRALDVGCGSGNYSIYLARQGFDVVGIDYSPEAIQIAQQRAHDANVSVRFQVVDMTKESIPLQQTFDFIFDYSILHHIAPNDVTTYVHNEMSLLNPGGKLLLICYSEKDEDARGLGSAVGKYGNVMYYRTADEIRAMYKGLNERSYRETKLGKRLHHAGHCFLFEKLSK